jgi:hypothetical protein
MKPLIALAIIVALVVLYAVWGRAWLKTKPWMKGFFDVVEPIEVALWKKSETILFARLKMFSGLLLTLLTQLGTIDLTPLMPFVPDQYEGFVRVVFNMLPLVLTVLGAIDEKLRKDTTKPLELVAIADKDMPPEVAAAVAVADATKAEAVAIVQEAKAEGAV